MTVIEGAARLARDKWMLKYPRGTGFVDTHCHIDFLFNKIKYKSKAANDWDWEAFKVVCYLLFFCVALA